ncbi:MAG: hypothetical protein RSB42_12545, partial [Comamonas sp.]
MVIRPSAAFFLAVMRLREQQLRALYLVATLAVTVLAWIVLSTLTDPFLVSRAGGSINAGLTISNARAQADAFPLRYMDELERHPGVAGATYINVTALPCAAGRGVIPLNAVGGSGTVARLRASGVPREMIEHWRGLEQGVLVGTELAERCNLMAGMSLQPTDLLSGIVMPLTIVGVLPQIDAQLGNRIAYAHYEYINRMLPATQQNRVMRGNVTAVDAASIESLAQAISHEFASSDPPLLAEPNTTIQNALGRFGQVQGLLGMVMLAMAACTLLVFITVLAHLTARRRASMGALQALGFSRRLQFVALTAELGAQLALGT